MFIIQLYTPSGVFMLIAPDTHYIICQLAIAMLEVKFYICDRLGAFDT